MPASPDIINALDIGSSMIRVVVAQLDPDADKPRILGVGTHAAGGMRKGVIVDIEDVVAGMSAAIEQAERVSGHRIEHAYVSVNGAHIGAQESEGVVAVSRADGEIDEADVARAIEAAQTVSLPPNHEIIHVIPKSFVVDNQAGIKDPVGMTGVRLECKVHLIHGVSSHIKNITKAVYRAGLEIDDLVFSALASSDAVLTKRQKELGVVVVDVGEGTSGMVVFEEGELVHAAVLPVGAGHITNDMALDLRCPVEVADRIKIEAGTALYQEVMEKEKIRLSDFDPKEQGEVLRRHVARVIEARVEEIFSLIDKELKNIDRSRKLPAGVVITGGGAKLSGMVDVAKETMKLPAQIGFPVELPAALEQLDDPAYAASVGLLLWGVQEIDREAKGKPGAPVGESVEKIRKWFRSLLP